MCKVSIYLVPYHSEPELHLNNEAHGQFAAVETAIAGDEWPYDNGDDPAFYVARRGGPLTWGVCRQDVRNAIKPGSIVAFFAFTSRDRKIQYRLSAVATVAEKLDRRVVYREARFRRYRNLYLNLLIRPGTVGWEYDESDREPRARHRDWLWRIGVHGSRKQPFETRYKRIYRTGAFQAGDVALARNYVVFSTAENETHIAQAPPTVAIALRGKREKWCDSEVRNLTVAIASSRTKNRRGYLRVPNPTGRNVHRQIHFNLPVDEAHRWRRALISALRRRS